MQLHPLMSVFLKILKLYLQNVSRGYLERMTRSECRMLNRFKINVYLPTWNSKMLNSCDN